MIINKNISIKIKIIILWQYIYNVIIAYYNANFNNTATQWVKSGEL